MSPNAHHKVTHVASSDSFENGIFLTLLLQPFDRFAKDLWTPLQTSQKVTHVAPFDCFASTPLDSFANAV